jgi:CBS domain-containing protein
MNVATILQHKGGNVVTTRPGTSIAEITSLLCGARIGAVVVSADRVRVEGIVSERDIIRALAQHGGAALSMTAEDIMTRDVVTCTPEDIAADLMAMMTAGRFRHIPVCEEGALVGLVSIGDVVRVRVDEIEHEAEALRTYVTQG